MSSVQSTKVTKPTRPKIDLENLDPSPSRHPQLTTQVDWTLKYINHVKTRGVKQFLGFTKFKVVSRESMGTAEIIRMLFSYADIDFEDVVLHALDWKAAYYKMPYGTLPVLWMDDMVYGETNTIVRLLARQMNLLGRNEAETMVVEAVMQQVTDLKESEVLQKAYEENSVGDASEVAYNTLLPTAFKFWGQQIDKTHGPFVLWSGISVADLAIYDFVVQYSKFINLEPFLDENIALAEMKEAVQTHPWMVRTYFKGVNQGRRV